MSDAVSQPTDLQEVKKYPHGTFSWPELQTTDGPAAKKFYGELLGWTAVDQPIGDGTSYTMFQLHGKEVAGMYGNNPDVHEGKMPPNWGCNMTVDNIEETASKVEAAGGTVIMPPFDVMTAGRMAVVQDPTGAIFSLWEARDHIGAKYVNIPGALMWNELLTHDLEKATDFYNKVIGWTTEVDTSGGMPYTTFKNGERYAGGAMAITPEMGQMPSAWTLYFNVDSLEAAIAKAKELGATILREPMETPAGPFAVVQDPQGAVFQLMQAPRVDPPPQG